MFFVWDGNHKFHALYPFIEKLHSKEKAWHISVDTIMLDTITWLVELLMITYLNK